MAIRITTNTADGPVLFWYCSQAAASYTCPPPKPGYGSIIPVGIAWAFPLGAFRAGFHTIVLGRWPFFSPKKCVSFVLEPRLSHQRLADNVIRLGGVPLQRPLP